MIKLLCLKDFFNRAAVILPHRRDCEVSEAAALEGGGMSGPAR